MDKKRRRESRLAVIAIIAIISAWFIGIQREDDVIRAKIETVMDQVSSFEEIDNSSYKIYNEEDEHIGFITLESSIGYGGPILMCVAVNLEGEIIELGIIDHKETPSYLEKVLDAKYLDRIIGRTYNDEYSIGNGIDAVSSATYSSRAIVEASKRGNRYIAAHLLGLEVPEVEKQKIQFGAPEIILILLFAIGYFAHKKTFKYKKQARWFTMIAGLIFIGFAYNKPFSLSMFNQLLLGYFPPIHSHLYWYLLLGGIFFVFTVDNKNPYCQWFCPFGAAQEVLGQIGGAKKRFPGRFKNFFKWTLRAITFFAIIVALLFRNPGVTSYEVFGTLFKLTGTNLQFAILGIVLVASIFIKRPWCNYLCPIRPVTDHIACVRRSIKNIWKRRKQRILVRQ